VRAEFQIAPLRTHVAEARRRVIINPVNLTSVAHADMLAPSIASLHALMRSLCRADFFAARQNLEIKEHRPKYENERVEVDKLSKNNVIQIGGKSLITLNTFAKNFGLHVRTVQLWARQHEMPLIRIGNQMLLDVDDIPEWLSRHKNQTGR
jgi:excisionase family DNA binding protein